MYKKKVNDWCIKCINNSDCQKCRRCLITDVKTEDNQTIFGRPSEYTDENDIVSIAV